MEFDSLVPSRLSQHLEKKTLQRCVQPTPQLCFRAFCRQVFKSRARTKRPNRCPPATRRSSSTTADYLDEPERRIGPTRNLEQLSPGRLRIFMRRKRECPLLHATPGLVGWYTGVRPVLIMDPGVMRRLWFFNGPSRCPNCRAGLSAAGLINN